MQVKVLGHHNPNNEYPGFVLPVGYVNGNKFIVFNSSLNEDGFRYVEDDFVFQVYDDPISDFDSDEEILFAYSDFKYERIKKCNVADEIVRLFVDGVFDELNPFVALSYAIKTHNRDIVLRVMKTCILELRSQSDNLLYNWYKKIYYTSEYSKALKRYKIPDNPELIVNDIKGYTIRIGGSFDFAYVLRKLARKINNSEGILISNKSVWVEPIVKDLCELKAETMYRHFDIVFLEDYDYLFEYDLKSFVSPLSKFDVGYGLLVLGLNPNYKGSEVLKGKVSLESLYEIIERKNGIKNILCPTPEDCNGMVISRSIQKLLKKKKIFNHYYTSMLDAVSDVFDGDKWYKDGIIGSKHALVSAFESISRVYNPKYIEIDDILIQMKIKAFLLSSNISINQDIFKRLEEELILDKYQRILYESGIKRTTANREEKNADYTNIQIYNKKSLDFEGKYGVYERESVLGETEYLKTILATVTEKKPIVNKKFADDWGKGDSVVISYPYIHGRRECESFENYIAMANRSLKKGFDIYSRMIYWNSVALAYDFGVARINGHASNFMVQEYIEGETLTEWMSEKQKNNVLVTDDEFFNIARKLTVALKKMHQVGVLHGFINPDNIKLKDDDPVIVNVGHGIMRKEYINHYKIRRSNIDSPFSAPENDFSVEADVFSLCALFYYIATGEEYEKKNESALAIKRAVMSGIKYKNYQLYKNNAGIVDIIARGLRYKVNRTQNTQMLNEDIEIFDPKRRVLDEQGLGEIRSMIKTVKDYEEKDPFIVTTILSKLDEINFHVEEMKSGVYDIRGEHNDLVLAIARFMSCCEKGDMYLTASIPWLWYSSNMGINGRLLSINKKIMKNGTIFRRVFVLTRDELEDPQVIEVLRAHKEVIEDISDEEKIINTKKPQLSSKGVYTGVVVVDGDEKEDLFGDNPHSGIWIRRSKKYKVVKIIEPFYDEEKRKLNGFRIREGDKDDVMVKEKFEKIFLEKSKEVTEFFYEEYLKEIDSKVSTKLP